MARLQDLNPVTPTASDNVLIVQSTGQGLATFGSTIGAKMNSTNPTGAGALSLNRKAGTSSGTYSVTEGYNGTASGVASHATGEATTANGRGAFSKGLSTVASGDYSVSEGRQTTASGLYSHASGYQTQATRRSQHVIGEYNTADTSGADGTAKGEFIEIAGNGSSNNARSNARTLDWSGNEKIAGDLIYNSNVSLSRILRSYTLTSAAPLNINVGRHCTLFILGFAQGIGAVAVMLMVTGSNLASIINMQTGAAWTSSHLTFSLSNNVLTLTSDSTSGSDLTIIYGGN